MTRYALFSFGGVSGSCLLFSLTACSGDVAPTDTGEEPRVNRIELETPFTVIANATFNVQANLFDEYNTLLYEVRIEWSISDTTRLARVGGCALATPCDMGYIELETRGAGSVTLSVTAGEQSVTRPLTILPAARFVSVSVGETHDCAVAADGTAYCFGLPPGFPSALGRAIEGSGAYAMLPLPVESNARFASVSAGSNHSCGVTTQGEVHCWGRNDHGQTGRGQLLEYVTPGEWVVPGAINGSLRFQMVSAGFLVTCAVTDDGRAFCWGDNRKGELGDSTRQVALSVDPVEVAGGLKWATVDVSPSLPATICGLTTDGAAYCWGSNDLGQVGNGSREPVRSPAPVDGNLVFSTLSVGVRHVCGLADNQSAYCWGSNATDELGVTTTGELCGGGACGTRPVKVESNLAWTDVALASGQHSGSVFGGGVSCALSVDGTLYCWGVQCWGFGGEFGSPPPCRQAAQPEPYFDQVAFQRLGGAWRGCGIGTDSLAYCWPGFGTSFPNPPELELVPGQRALP